MNKSFYTLVSLSLLFLPVQTVYAYEFELGNFNFYEVGQQPVQKSTPQSVNLGTDQTIRIVRSKEPIAYTLSDNSLNFGELSPGEPLIRSHEISVLENAQNGTQLYISENAAPTSPKGIQLPDTRCDNGSCSEAVAAAWTSALSYGFGFRCDVLSGNGSCTTDFSHSSFFRQIANNTAQEAPTKIMTTPSSLKKTTFEITYKINIPSSQELDAYTNTVSIIALPQL
jgi:hypothetical protein